jgi:hypothetical protein
MSTVMLFMSERTSKCILNFIVDYEFSYCAHRFGPTSDHVLRITLFQINVKSYEIKWPERETDHLPSTIAQVNRTRVYISTPPGSGSGSTQPREYNWGDTWKK